MELKGLKELPLGRSLASSGTSPDSLGAVSGSLGLSWASLRWQNSPEQTQSWGPSEISEIVTIPTQELHFRFFVGFS